MLVRAQSRGADALIVDLEDGVAPARKGTARRTLRDRLGEGLPGPSRVYVRVNPLGAGGEDDFAALTGLRLDGLVVPKVEGPDAVREVVERVAALAPQDGAGGPLSIVPAIESARGVVRLGEILTAASAVEAVALGGEDLAADLGVVRSDDSVELLFPRAWTAFWARATGVAALDTVYTRIEDRAGLLRDARLAAGLGFAGKLVVHPAQIPVVHEAFAPGPETVAWAQRVLEVVGREGRDRLGVSVVEGRLVDEPVVRQAERVLAVLPPSAPKEE